MLTVIAIWALATFLAWLFVYGAGRATESNSLERARNITRQLNPRRDTGKKYKDFQRRLAAWSFVASVKLQIRATQMERPCSAHLSYRLFW